MPYVQLGRRQRKIGLNLSDKKPSDFEAKQHEEELQRIAEEERRSISKIQNEVFKARQYWRECVKKPVSQQDISIASSALQEKLASNTVEKISLTAIGDSCLLPGVMYQNNGNVRVNRGKLKSLTKAQDELLGQLKASQNFYHDSLHNKKERRSSIGQLTDSHLNRPYSKRHVNKTDLATDVKYHSSTRRGSRAITNDHACRGIAGRSIYRPDCKLCMKLMNDKMKALTKFQEAAIGTDVIEAAEQDTTPTFTRHESLWKPAPQGKWYSRESSFVDSMKYIDKLPINCSQETRNRARIQQRVALDSYLVENPEMADKIGYERRQSLSSHLERRRTLFSESQKSSSHLMGLHESRELITTPAERRRRHTTGRLSADIPDIHEECDMPSPDSTKREVMSEPISVTIQQPKETRASDRKVMFTTDLQHKSVSQRGSLNRIESKESQQSRPHSSMAKGSIGWTPETRRESEYMKPWQVRGSLLETAHRENEVIKRRVSNFISEIENFVKESKTSEAGQLHASHRSKKDSLLTEAVIQEWSSGNATPYLTYN